MKRPHLPVWSRGSWRLRGSCCSRRPSVFGSRTEEFCLVVKSAEFSSLSRSSSSANCCAKAPTIRATSTRTASRLDQTILPGNSWFCVWNSDCIVTDRCVIRWVTWRCRTTSMAIPVSSSCGLEAQQSGLHCKHPLRASRWPGWRPSAPCWTPRTTSCLVSTWKHKYTFTIQNTAAWMFIYFSFNFIRTERQLNLKKSEGSKSRERQSGKSTKSQDTCRETERVRGHLVAERRHEN